MCKSPSASQDPTCGKPDKGDRKRIVSVTQILNGFFETTQTDTSAWDVNHRRNYLIKESTEQVGRIRSYIHSALEVKKPDVNLRLHF